MKIKFKYMNHPKITVVTVCYNAERDIENTILSVINQTYGNIEYIIVDGASTDGTMQVVEKYKDKIAKIVSEPDKGIYDAMNKALKLATGDFLIFMGSDDLFYTKDTLKTVSLKLTEIDAVHYGQVKWTSNGMLFWGKFNKWKFGISNICHQAIFYPRSVYIKYGYDTKYRVFADYVYNLNLIKEKFNFLYLDVVITLYNNEGFSSVAKDVEFDANKRRLYQDSIGFMPFVIGVIYRFLLRAKHSLKSM